ncbi:hypothetical protein [Companilactobacillus paralimentarius]|uniref:hypothetical protein n=1 Tax=Companilactobacillus paralimentarius TaxID=83526 RepID=UPI00384F50C1
MSKITLFFGNTPSMIVNDKIWGHVPNITIRYTEMKRQTCYKNAIKSMQRIKKLIYNDKIPFEDYKKLVTKEITDFINYKGTNISQTTTQYQPLLLPKGTLLYRITDTKNHIWAPPREITRIGRMNKDKEHCLYLSFNPEVTLPETKTEKYENNKFMNTYQTRKDITIITTYSQQFQDPDFCNDDHIIGKNLASYYNLLFGLISSDNVNLNKRIYYITNTLKDLFVGDHHPSGIIYPSVKMSGTNKLLLSRDGKPNIDYINLALYTNDEKYYLQFINNCSVKDFFMRNDK